MVAGQSREKTYGTPSLTEALIVNMPRWRKIIFVKREWWQAGLR
jgi:hypothetical protein